MSRYPVDVWLPQHNYDNVCYYFFKDNDEQSRLPPALAAILHQFFGLRRDLIEPCALPAWSATGDKISEEATQMWRILEGLRDTGSDDRRPIVICVIDALDECRDNDRRQLINFLCRLHANSSARSQNHAVLKFVVTSRPYNNVERWFSNVSQHFPQIQLRGEDEDESINNEINLVIKHHVHDLVQRFNLSERSKDRLLDVLLDLKHRTYLWLHLAIEDIREALELSLLPDSVKIDMVPLSVEDAYERILAKVKAKQIPIVKRILKLTLAAARPFETEEVAIALAVASRSDNDNSHELHMNVAHVEKQIREWCGLFVFIRHSKLYLIHQTAKEFLLRSLDAALPTGTRWKGCLTQSECELETARATVQYLLLQRIICTHQIWGSCRLLEWSRKPDVGEQINFFAYSVKHWAAHLKRACVSDSHKLVEQSARLCVKGTCGTASWFLWWCCRCNPYEWSKPLEHHVAAFVGSLVTLIYIHKTRNFDLENTTEDGMTALACAVQSGQEDVIQWLIRQGAETNIRDQYGESLLRSAARKVSARTLQTMLEAGADPSRDCETEADGALEAAIRGENEQSIQTLLKWGARVNWRDFRSALLSDRLPVLLGYMSDHDKHNVAEVQKTLRIATALNRNSNAVETLLKSGTVGRDSQSLATIRS